MAPSTTFLFDTARTGRSPFAVGEGEPRELWRTWLPSHPPRGAESTPAFDGDGNLYFGSHDGVFYSLAPNGQVRWTFKTDEKIYSSPTVAEDAVFFCGGNGFAYRFTLDGRMVWAHDLLGSLRRQPARRKALRLLRELPRTLDWGRLYNVVTKSWASPVLDGAGNLYVSGYGLALLSLTPGGERRWAIPDPGQYHLGGPCLDDEGHIWVTSRREALRVGPSGEIAFRVPLRPGENWPTPSYDAARIQGYVALSQKERSANLLALGKDGGVRWQVEIQGGLRGSVAIGAETLLVAALEGRLLWLDPEKGTTTRQVRLSQDSRGLWTTPALDSQGRVLITTKDGPNEGSLVCLEPNGEVRWRLSIGKSLCTPVVDAAGRIYVGSWDGFYRCVAT